MACFQLSLESSYKSNRWIWWYKNGNFKNFLFEIEYSYHKRYLRGIKVNIAYRCFWKNREYFYICSETNHPLRGGVMLIWHVSTMVKDTVLPTLSRALRSELKHQYLPVPLPPSSGSPRAGALTYLMPLPLDNWVRPMDPFSEYWFWLNRIKCKRL